MRADRTISPDQPVNPSILAPKAMVAVQLTLKEICVFDLFFLAVSEKHSVSFSGTRERGLRRCTGLKR